MELVDIRDLKSLAAMLRGGSTPPPGTSNLNYLPLVLSPGSTCRSGVCSNWGKNRSSLSLVDRNRATQDRIQGMIDEDAQ